MYYRYPGHGQINMTDCKKSSDVKVVILHDRHLHSLPNALFSLQNLRTLVLGSVTAGNQLTSLPAELGQLVHLESLWVVNNRLVRIPEAIGQLINLVELNLDGNLIECLDGCSLGHMAKLLRLSLARNRLTSVPDTCVMPNTTDLLLDLSDNCISVISSRFKSSFRGRMNLAGNRKHHAKCDQLTLPGPPSLLELSARKSLESQCCFRLPCVDLSISSKCASCPVRFLQPATKIYRSGQFEGHPEILLEDYVCSFSCLASSEERIDLVTDSLGNITLDPNCL